MSKDTGPTRERLQEIEDIKFDRKKRIVERTAPSAPVLVPGRRMTFGEWLLQRSSDPAIQAQITATQEKARLARERKKAKTPWVK